MQICGRKLTNTWSLVISVGQPDGVSVAQKEDAAETMDATQDEVSPQVNGNKVEKESPDANEITAVEEKVAEEKSDDASEVGFKKIFRFVGFKFTLKKDKSEEKDPVKLLTVKDKEDEDVSKSEEPAEKEEKVEAAVEKSTAEEDKTDAETPTAEVTEDKEKAETTDAVDEVKEGEAEKEEGSTPPCQETTLSPFRKLFNGGLFSNLRKKASIKKTKEEEDKEVATEEVAAKTEETAATAADKEEVKDEVEPDTKEVTPETPVEEKTEAKEEASDVQEEAKSETTPEPETTAESAAPEASTTDETTQDEEKTKSGAEEEKAPAELTTEAELLSSQEKAKTQGSPLKKLFTGAGLKKLSTKKQKTKKDAETKLTESGDLAADSTDSAEPPKAESGPSSPEDSGEHAVVVEEAAIVSSQETHGEVASDGEKKKEGIIAWSSFKKLVTPKRLVKRSSESEDEAPSEKPAKSATLSSSESAPLADKSVEEETKEEKPAEEEPKTETTEKLVSSTEEPKRKMDTSVSWEALMCMGGPKKRTRKTSDSDDEETKMVEDSAAAVAAGEQEDKAEAAIVSSQNTETDGEVVSSPEPPSSLPERESAWDTLKRVVMPKTKAKVEEKPAESSEQVQSDSEAPKDESSFSFKKFLTGRRKKKVEKQASSDQGSGEEDSDTPAVVPLSEYSEQVEVQPEAPAEPAAVQTKVSAEDRSPSWIPATVEDVDGKHEELSDIPEEAETAATPKSVDTDVAEDETENDDDQLPKRLGPGGRRLSTAEVKPLDPAPAAETTPVPQGPKPENAKEVMEAMEPQVNEVPTQTSVAVTDVPIEVASEKTEYEPPTEKAESKTNTILEPHTCDEAMAICTGLGAKEIAKVALEKPAVTLLEIVAEVGDALCTEVVQEEKPPCADEASIAEDEVLNPQVHQIEITTLEPLVENSPGDEADIQVACETDEPQIEKAGIVSTTVQESEVLQPAAKTVNSPKVVVDSITPTTEAAICTPSTEVTEPTVEVKEKEIEVEQLSATEANTPVAAVVEAMCETKASMKNETEPAVPVVEPCEEVPVITETVVLVAPSTAEADQVGTSDGAAVSEPASNKEIQAQETGEDTPMLETVEADKKEKESETEVQGGSDLEAQSMAIAQTVIQDAMDKVSEDVQEPKSSPTPTSEGTPAPHQAVATTEKEMEVSADTPIITDTPGAVTCEKTPQPLCVAMEVTDAVPVEVTGTLDEVEEDANKSEEGLKKAEEVKVSEESVVVEEVVEMQEESQTEQEPEQVREEESKEDTDVQEPEVKETAEETKPQLDEAKSEKPQEEDKEAVREIHMPVQVVLQTAKVMEEPSVEEEAVVELDSNGPVDKESTPKASSVASEDKLPVVSEEPQATAPADASQEQQADAEAAGGQPEAEKTSSSKCAEVMAQVIEVIEEAVKEIEPVSEITAAS